MRRSTLTVWIVVSVVLAGTLVFLYTRYRQARAELATLHVSEEAARDRYARTVDAIVEIQDSLNTIIVGDANVPLVEGGLKAERALGSPDGSEALDRIANLRASIDRSKKRIRQLESSMHASQIEVKGLRRMVSSLKASVAAKEEQLAELHTRVEHLNTQVSGLETTVQEKQEQIAQQDQTLEDRRRELATVYYVVGSRRELTTEGLVVARGGVLGMGKTLQPTGRLTADRAVPLDTDAQLVVTIPAPHAQVVTDQPEASYELRLVDGQTELHILNPAEFRKVRQLIIVTA